MGRGEGACPQALRRCAIGAYDRVSLQNLNNASHWSKVRPQGGPEGSNLRYDS